MADQHSKWRRPNLRWILAASIGLNLLFVGAFVGAAYRHAGGPGARDGGPPDMRSYATPYVRALPKDKRRALFQALRNGDQGVTTLSKQERRALYQQMVTALRATPFDPVAVKQVLTVQRDAVLGLQSAAQNRWLQEVTDMSEAERASYADELEKVLRRKPGRGDRRKKQED